MNSATDQPHLNKLNNRFVPSTVLPQITLARFTMRQVFLCIAGLIGTVFIAGCAEQEPITTYRVPTKIPDELLPGKDRMLAAMIPLGDEVWYFKVTGPEEPTAEIVDEFRKFVSDVEFKDGEPDLSELPETWRRGKNRPMRFATIDVATDAKQLEISVTNLPRRDDWDVYVAENINRWRGQLGAEPLEEKWAGAEPIDIKSADGPSVWFDLVGQSQGSSGMPPMMAGMNGRGMAPPQAPTQDSSAQQTPPREPKSNPLKFERPDEWRDGRESRMRLASFAAGPSSAPADIYVMPAGGNIRDNVKRWIEQVRESSVSDEIVDGAMAEVEKRKVAGRDAQRFILTAENPKSGDVIDGTIVPLDSSISMFIKMVGPAETVTAQADAMSQFLDSLQF